MAEEVKEIELAAGTKIPGEKVDYIVLKAGFKYPMPDKKVEEPAAVPAAEDKKPDGETPPAAPPAGEVTPEGTELSTEMKSDLEEVKAVKTILSNKILQTELSTNAELDVEKRKAELMKLKLNDLTNLLPKAAPDKQPGEGYTTDMALSQGAQKKKQGAVDLRSIVEAGVDGGVL